MGGGGRRRDARARRGRRRAGAREYEPLPFVLDAEEAYAPGSPLVHAEHGSNVLLDQHLRLGRGREGFRRQPASPVAAREMGPQLDRADRNLRRGGELGPVARDARRLRLDPDAAISRPDRASRSKCRAPSVRVHYDVDVGGSYGVKRGIKHTVLVGYLSRRLGFPVRLIEDRLENMRGGDAHGPGAACSTSRSRSTMTASIRSMKMRALDNVGAYAGRSPFQLGKPIGAIVGPYSIRSVQYRAIAVMSPTRRCRKRCAAFGQAPTNFALERAHGRGRQHARARPAGNAPAQPDPRRTSSPI